MNLKINQFYALIPNQTAKQLFSPSPITHNIEVLLYFLEDRKTFIEVSLHREGAYIVESAYDYIEWWNQRKKPSDYGIFTYNPINLTSLLTNDEALFRDFARRYYEFDHSQLIELWGKDLDHFKLDILDFDSESGIVNTWESWYPSPHEYSLIRAGIAPFSDLKKFGFSPF